MLFANDIVIVVESKAKLNAMVDIWKASLEQKGLQVSTNKMECRYILRLYNL